MISANLVRDLREKTGAGMMDCKKALVENNGDFDAAIDWLRTKGLAAAAKKSGRITAEGLTALYVEGNVGAVIELNSETDFVARNEQFQTLVSTIVKEAIKSDDIEFLKNSVLSNGKTVLEEVNANISTIGENLNLRRMGTARVTDGVIGSYVHNSIANNMGKIAVLVALESKGDKEELNKLGKQIAMHIAASRPLVLTNEEVDQTLVEKERSIFIEQTKASGKPESIIEKMVEGRIRKFYEEIVLLDQIFVVDGKSSISEVLADASKRLGSDVKITSFVRLELGEGVEVQDTDFAAEVASVIKN